MVCYVKEGKAIKGKDYNGKKFVWKVGRQVSCESKNIVYLLECDKDNCKKQYIGITHQEFRERIYQHVGYVKNKILSRATGEHFNLPGHGTHHMKFSIVEQVKSRHPTGTAVGNQIFYPIPHRHKVYFFTNQEAQLCLLLMLQHVLFP